MKRVSRHQPFRFALMQARSFRRYCRRAGKQDTMSATPRTKGFGFAFALSWIAGFVDAVGYLVLYRVFVANMSGNTVALAVESIQHRWAVFFARGAAIPLFVLGMLLSKWGVYLAKRRHFSRLPALVYALEALLLGLFVLIGIHHMSESGDKVQSQPMLTYYVLIALPSLAMGLQNAMHTHFGPFNLHTTHVTGTLAKFTDELAQFLVWFWERTRGRMKRRVKKVLALSMRHESLRNAVVLAFVWLFYLMGGAVGVLLKKEWGLFSLLIPILLLVVFVGADLRRPTVLETNGVQP